MSKKRIVVAMSGGVDSSVVAALLAHEGHEVIGITLRLWTPSPWNNGEKYGGCCSPQDITDAKEVCRQSGISHYTFDLEEKFREKVVDNFVSEYLDGKTPNPCVRCNSFIKFDVLLKYAVAMNADYLATGHYARIERAGEYFLTKAKDATKDQSYFLYMLNQEQLSKLIFPLGDMNKTEVRALAEKFTLVTANKEDSQDVCFLEGRNYRDFIGERISEERIRKGVIQTREGKILGAHQGLPYYTIGQREKLGIAAGHPMYVIEKNSETNALVVGPVEENLRSGCHVHSVHWCSDHRPDRSIQASIKIRYRHPGASSLIVPLPLNEVEVKFDTPQASVTPGQSAVFYDGDRVLGGGVIG